MKALWRRNPKKREFAMQMRDEKCIAFLAFFAKQKATQINKKNMELYYE